MPFNGSGTYNLPAGNPVVNNTTASSTVYNNTNSDIATALTNCLTKDGQSTPTADIDLAGFELTTVAAGTELDSAANVLQLQNNGAITLSSVSGTDTITAAVSPVPSAYATGQIFWFEPAGNNTGATTIDISSLGAKSILNAGAALVAGDLVSGIPVAIRYDGTQFEIVARANTASLGATGLQTFAGPITVTGAFTNGSVDINGGAIDGTTIGATTPAAATITALTVNTSATFSGATIADLGTVTTADINGGTLDGVTIGGASAAAGTFTTISANAGSAASPTYTFTSDTDLGLFRATTDTLGFTTNGTERARITSGGYAKFSDDGAYTNYAGTDVSGASYHVFNQSASNLNVFASTQATGAGYVSFFSDIPSASSGFHFKARENGTIVCEMQADGDIFNRNGTYGTISDRKLKQNIVKNSTSRIAEIMALEVVNYELKNKPNKKLLGFIAQDFEQVFPSLVSDTPDTEDVEVERETVNENGENVRETVTERRETGTFTKQIKTSLLTPILVQAVQEQQATIEAQQATIEAQAAALAALEARLTALEGA